MPHYINHPITGDPIQVAENDFPQTMGWDNAMNACKGLGNGWRLPNKEELSVMYEQLHKHGKGNFKDNIYWSSSEKDAGHALNFSFDIDNYNGFYEDLEKLNKLHVRAVRALSLRAVHDSISIFDLSINKIPKSINYRGEVINALSFKDKTGDYIVFTTETGVYRTKSKENEMEFANAYLYAFLYLKENNQFKKIWQIQDFIEGCPTDLEATYVENTFKVTDLDNNGIAEVWLMYRIVCRSDVGPSDMKIIMYEGSKKYAIRGENKVFLGSDNYLGGEYMIDESFELGPKVFLNFAKKMWSDNITSSSTGLNIDRGN